MVFYNEDIMPICSSAKMGILSPLMTFGLCIKCNLPLLSCFKSLKRSFVGNVNPKKTFVNKAHSLHLVWFDSLADCQLSGNDYWVEGCITLKLIYRCHYHNKFDHRCVAVCFKYNWLSIQRNIFKYILLNIWVPEKQLTRTFDNMTSYMTSSYYSWYPKRFSEEGEEVLFIL